MRIIAGDIGGTKTLLQLVEVTESARTVIAERRYESGKFASFDALLRDFIAPGAVIDAACFAVAGPVLDERAEVTNLKWKMESAALQHDFAIGRVALINDFYAVAVGVPILAPGDRLVLQEGIRQPHSPIAILGAGTGLGQAFLTWSEGQWQVLPSEGGHADFAPQDELQCRLMLSLIERYGHASWERVCSGMGLANIFAFLGGEKADPAAIAAMANRNEQPAKQAMEIFVDIYGSEAGNMALRVLSRGGVYLAGGIAAKNAAHFTGGRFMTAFLRKGRFRELLQAMPVEIITNEKVGLLGAVEMARRLGG